MVGKWVGFGVRCGLRFWNKCVCTRQSRRDPYTDPDGARPKNSFWTREEAVHEEEEGRDKSSAHVKEKHRPRGSHGATYYRPQDAASTP